MKKIFIVDNDPLILSFLENMLFKKGYQVKTAPSGLIAMDILKTFTPDCMFIDLVMPNIDGRKLCKIIRNDHRLDGTCLAIMSAIAVEEQMDVSELPADVLIAKGPFNEMTENILFVIEKPDLARTICAEGNTLGLKNLGRRSITEELLSVKKHFELILDRMSEGILEITCEGRIVYTNPVALALMGVPEQEMLGRHLTELFNDQDIPRVKKLIRSNCDRIQSISEDDPVKLGKSLLTLTLIPLGPKEDAKNILILNDVTHRKQAEKKLFESQEKYRNILESIEEGYFEVDISGNITFFNNSLCKISGYAPDELMGMNNREYTTDGTADRMYRVFNKVFRTGASVKIEDFEIITKSGNISILELSTSLIRSLSGDPIGFRGLVRDVTTRKKAQEAIIESELKFRSLFELSPQAVSLTDITTSRIEDTNQKFCQLFKIRREDVIGCTPVELQFYSMKDHQRFIQKLEDSGDLQGLEMTFKDRDGFNFTVQLFARLIQMERKRYILTLFHDTTHQKKLEAQLLQAQKMEAIGTLAGGIAHNFNNLLMGIQGYASLAMLNVDPEHPIHSKMEHIEKLVQSGSKLTGQLLGYARGGKYEVRTTNLNRLAKETSDTFGLARRDIRVHQHLEEPLPGVEVDQGQMEQVLLNLLVNAGDAMPGGGDLFLKTQCISHRDIKDKPYEIKPGNYVLLTMRDTGLGMDRKVMERIFEPFFTTKGLGRGTGLGLASAYGILKAHGGYIDVDSEIDRGSTFEIYLPASRNAEKKEKETIIKIQKGTETILLVDDEEIVLDVGKSILERLGYTVVTADSGQRAMAAYEKNPKTIDLVILDMIMPETSGSETYDRMKLINPEIKVLLSSGYSLDGKASEIMERGCNGFIQKPFGIKELSEKIRNILG